MTTPINSCININLNKLNSKINTYYTISVILNVDNDSQNDNSLYNSLYSLLNQDYNEYFSMEIIILTHLQNIFQNNTELKDLCKIKNVKITIITLFEHSLLSSLSKYTIGLNLSNNNYILFTSFVFFYFKIKKRKLLKRTKYTLSKPLAVFLQKNRGKNFKRRVFLGSSFLNF